jgi:hypothetical protein
MTKITWHLEKRKLSELIEWECNPRNLTEKGIKDLTKSIKKFGCCEPIVINTDNMICGGHGRKKVLEQLDVKEVDCYVPHETLTKEEFEELNLRLNKNISGEFNIEMLANNFEIELLHDIGFTNEELGLNIEEKEPDKILNSEQYLQKFSIVIECENEEQQEQLYLQLQKQGLKCKILSI